MRKNASKPTQLKLHLETVRLLDGRVTARLDGAQLRAATQLTCTHGCD